MLADELDRHDRKYFWVIFATLLIGVCMGILGDYRGRQLNANQLIALKNHETIIRDYNKLIRLHEKSINVIERFLAQEKELVQYHTEYVRDNKETHIMLNQVIDLLKSLDRKMAPMAK